ncbi:MAG: hypothetical protein Q4P18_05835 [Methanobrevibacter sp.]|uniref:hypothetical protein n=1 Tax=Methanobrevibacter sp. TaxID=66852 RepID=UPI0026DEB181|nr:hypothetical protein [Methanobrevibacter sp.]MDO5849034.1 hypothetical protein [Methanobrevibacter sp.]
MEWNSIWLSLFGTTDYLGFNMGFWVSLVVVALVVVIMNVVFWNMKPYSETQSKEN